MSGVWHLVRHDIRVHWRVMLAWVALIVAHPIVAALASPDAPILGANAGSTAMAASILGARLVLCAVLVTALVQQDAPNSDRVYWRTTPISSGTMAAAKGITTWTLTLLLPICVVCVVAWLAGVPLAQWPGIVKRVLWTDGALVGVILVSAAFTRHMSTALVAVVGTLASAVLVFGTAARVAAHTFDHTGRLSIAVDPFIALPTLLLIGAVTTWTVALLAWSGHRRRRAMLVVVGSGALALLAAWHLPAARLHRREPPTATPTMALRLSASDVRARALPGERGQVALVTTYHAEGTATAAVERLRLTEGHLDLGSGPTPARGLNDPDIAPPSARGEAVIGIVSRTELATAAGRRGRFRGRFDLDTRVGSVVDAASLATNVVLVSPGAAFRGAATPTADISIARGALTVVRQEMAPARGIDFFLRDPRSGVRVGPLFVWYARTALSYLTLLPTLTHPFEWDTVELRLAGNLPPSIDLRHATLELQETTDPSLRIPVDATLEFTVPSVVTGPETPDPVRP